jgi:ABC-2 type transport system ATP-binding protein
MIAGVRVTSLTKTYGKILALSDVSFEVTQGSIYGLIGPNGAGKTTSMAILAGLIQATSGSAWILGMEVQPGRGDLVSKIGFYSPQFPFLDYLTGMELLLACGLMHGLSPKEAKSRTRDLLELLDLESAAGLYLSQYSQGMRQKIGLACALIHAPVVLLMDEPFSGLDPTSVWRLSCCFRQIKSRGGTIVVSSHALALVERLCGRVGILHRGILKREIELAANGEPRAQDGSKANPESDLESVLWETIGRPEMKTVSWL